MRVLHNCPGSQRGVLLARAATENHRGARFEAVRLLLMPAGWAGEAPRPLQRFKVLGAGYVVREELLKLGERRREAECLHTLILAWIPYIVNERVKHGRKNYFRLAEVLAIKAFLSLKALPVRIAERGDFCAVNPSLALADLPDGSDLL